MENDNKIKHLEFIQLVITRMNVNSFLLKGWCLTLLVGILTLFEKEDTSNFDIVVILMVVLWIGLYIGGRLGKATGKEQMHQLNDFMNKILNHQ